jgi:hypothetical protein
VFAKVAFSIAITPLSKNAGGEKYRMTHKKSNRMKKANVYQTVTNNILASMENEIIPWKKSFKTSFSPLPFNFSTEKAYRGINVFLLNLACLQYDYPKNSWPTFKQAIQMGASILCAFTGIENLDLTNISAASLSALVETKRMICDLYPLLTDDDFRDSVLQQIPNPKVGSVCKAFFENEFTECCKNRTVMMGSTTTKVSALTDNPNIFYMLGQKENHLNIREIMDRVQILIADLGDCDDETKRLFGTLIVTGFEHTTLFRSRMQQKDRKTYYLYIDEFQDFACNPGAAETFSHDVYAHLPVPIRPMRTVLPCASLS